MEKAESFIVLANILRTAPYTVMGAGRWEGRIAFSMLTRDPPLPTHPDCAQAYVATLSAGIIFNSRTWLSVFAALIFCEISNHLFKAILKRALGPAYTARPVGAKDCGIYPQHRPKVSLSSGMPSGHSQTTGFLASLLLKMVEQRVPAAERALPTAYVLLFSALVLLSRTRFGGPFVSVSVDGKIAGCHTVLQVRAQGGNIPPTHTNARCHTPRRTATP